MARRYYIKYLILGFIVAFIGIPIVEGIFMSTFGDKPTLSSHLGVLFTVSLACGVFIGAIAGFSQQEKEKTVKHNNRRSEVMNNFPIVHNRTDTGIIPYDPYPLSPSTTFLTPASPETEIARISPPLAARVLMQQSLDQSLVSLANSSVATEFARQGRGTFVAARRKRHFFGGETTEIIIRPID